MYKVQLQLGNSPLITAIKKLNVQIDIVRLLVEMGANVNHVDNTVIYIYIYIYIYDDFNQMKP